MRDLRYETPMSDETLDDDGGAIDRRTMLRISSVAVASGAAFSGVASAGKGRGRGKNNGRSDRDDSYDGGDTDELVVFCGCSQVCACDCPVDVYIAGAEDAEIEGGSGCYETDEGQILAIRYQEENTENPGDVICNPNTNCADFDKYDGDLSREDCDVRGTRPQDGARCGQSFLDRRCDIEQ